MGSEHTTKMCWWKGNFRTIKILCPFLQILSCTTAPTILGKEERMYLPSTTWIHAFCVVLLNCCAYHSGQGSGQGRGQGREDVHCSLVITWKIVLCPMPSSTTGAFAASSHPAAATRQWPKYKHLLGQ